MKLLFCLFGCALQWVSLSYGSECAQTKKASECLSILENTLKENPSDVGAQFEYANLLYADGQYEKALAQLDSKELNAKELKLSSTLLRAKCLERLERFDDARAQYEDLLKQVKGTKFEERIEKIITKLKQPGAANFQRGFMAFEARQFEVALEHFEKSNEEFKNDETELMIALTLWRLDRRLSACQRVDAYSHKNTEHQHREALGELSKNCEQIRRLDKKGSFYVDASFGYDSNFYQDGPHEGGFSRGTYLASLGGSYRYFNAEPWSSEVGYRMGVTNYDVDLGTKKALFSHRIYNSVARRSASWSAYIIPTIDYDHFNRAALAFRGGVEASTVSRLVGTQELSFVYAVFRQESAQSDYRYLTGTIQRLSAAWSIRLNETTVAAGIRQTFYTVGDLELSYGTLPVRYHGPELFVRAHHVFLEKFSLDIRPAYQYRHYSSKSQPRGTERYDHQISLNGRISYSFIKELEFYLDMGWTKNMSTMGRSSLDDKNYSQTLILLGGTWALPF